MCLHIEHVPSIPAHWTGCISKESRTIKRFTTTHSCTFTRTHTQTHRQITHTQIAGGNRHLTVRAGPQQRKTRDWNVSAKAVSCSQTKTVGRHCCCWVGRGDPGRTAARLDWSARGEAWRQREKQNQNSMQSVFIYCKNTKVITFAKIKSDLGQSSKCH